MDTFHSLKFLAAPTGMQAEQTRAVMRTAGSSFPLGVHAAILQRSADRRPGILTVEAAQPWHSVRRSGAYLDSWGSQARLSAMLDNHFDLQRSVSERKRVGSLPKNAS